MSATSPRSGHELTHEEVVRGGQNSKRGPSAKTILEKIIAEKPPEEWIKLLSNPDDGTYGVSSEIETVFDMIEARLVVMAMTGDIRAIKEFHDRLEGKAVATHKIEGGDTPVAHTHNLDEKTLKSISELILGDIERKREE